MLTQRVYVVEYRHRRPGVNKNGVRRRWSRWRYYSVLTIKLVALARARNIRMNGATYIPGIYTQECDARVVPFDRRRQRRWR